MKKIALVALLLLTPLVQADTVLGLYLGGNLWRTDYSGEIGDSLTNLGELGVQDSDNSFYYVALEHPIPLFPNIKLQQTNITSQQTTTLTEAFTFRDTAFVAGNEFESRLDLSHTDLVLYYEVLDNWITLDLGLAARQFDGYASAKTGVITESVKIDELIPMFYAKAQFDLPLTGFSLGGSLNTVNYSDNDITDYTVFLGYTFDSTLDIGAELGYRSLNLTLDKKVLVFDTTMAGPYASILFHF